MGSLHKTTTTSTNNNSETNSSTNTSRTNNNIKNNVHTANGLELNNLKYTYPENHNIDDYYKKYIPNYNSTTPTTTLQSETNIASSQSPTLSPTYPPQPSSNYQPQSASYNNTPNYPYDTNNHNNILLEKLNYMIHLLEDKQDIKTKSTFEEILLYCLLGIFTIFLVDSFSRVGKYIR